MGDLTGARQTGATRTRLRAGGRRFPLLVAAGVAALVLVGASESAFPGVGGKIAFTSHRDGNFEIYVMNADGSGQRDLTNNPASDSDPVWSPDGTKIAFASDRDSNSEIFVMNADGSNQRQLTNNPSLDFAPAWSADGTKIAFVSLRDGNGEVYTMNAADGTSARNVSMNSANDLQPAWSPDNGKLAFRSNRDGNDEIYTTLNAVGSAQTRVTNNAASDSAPAWSPDGTRLVFATDRDGNAEIYTMGPDGSSPRNLTNDPGVDTGPAWSPDGAKLAFVSLRDGGSEVYVMNADGSGQTRLTGHAGDGDPDWQPLATADLELGLTGPASAVAGAELTYTSTIKSLGPATASGVTLSELVPAHTQFVRATESGGTCTTAIVGCHGTCRITSIKARASPEEVSCSVGSLAGGGVARVTLEVTVLPGFVGVVTDAATVDASDSSDPNHANDSRSLSTQLGVGVFRLSPLPARPGVGFVLELTWTAPRRWRDLRTVEVELVDRGRVAGTVRFVSDGSKTGRLGLGSDTGRPGEQRVLTRGLLSLLLGRSRVRGSGPTGRSVTLDFALQAAAGLAGHTIKVLVGATDVHGTRQPFASAGSLKIQR